MTKLEDLILDIVVTRPSADVMASIREAFAEMDRRLSELEKKQEGEKK